MRNKARLNVSALLLAAVLAPAISTAAPALDAVAPPTMNAKWVDQDVKARKREATVQLEVENIELVDPAKFGEQPKPGFGHVHYQLDDGPVIATPSNKLSFHGLKPGEHRLKVVLAGNDHSPLGPEALLTVRIP